jgi:hypothetical protein
MRKKKQHLNKGFTSKDGAERLVFVRMAKAAETAHPEAFEKKTGQVMYRHEWRTGCQNLIFASHEAAAKYFN